MTAMVPRRGTTLASQCWARRVTATTSDTVAGRTAGHRAAETEEDSMSAKKSRPPFTTSRHRAHHPHLPAALLLAVILGAGVAALAQGQAPRSPTPAPINGVVRVETVARGLEHPWGLAFLPDGRMLVTERPGRLRVVERDGRLSAPLAGVPAVLARGQGGLLDVALDPRFAENRLVYLSYSEPGGGRTAGTVVARGRLGEGRLEDVGVIYQQQPKVEGANHFGSRLVFARDGTLFVTQ